jgi:hypothetical protein
MQTYSRNGAGPRLVFITHKNTLHDWISRGESEVSEMPYIFAGILAYIFTHMHAYVRKYPYMQVFKHAYMRADLCLLMAMGKNVRLPKRGQTVRSDTCGMGEGPA